MAVVRYCDRRTIGRNGNGSVGIVMPFLPIGKISQTGVIVNDLLYKLQTSY